MATEKFANSASSTLNGGIDNAVTSLTVTSATTFPTAGQFRIKIDSEILLVTGVSGAVFTVTRAQEGTSAASHSNGAAVDHILTAGSLAKALVDNLFGPVFVTPPAAASFTVIGNTTSTQTLTDVANGVRFAATSAGVGEDNVLAVQSVGSSWTLTVGFFSHLTGAAYSMCGVCARNSTTREFRDMMVATAGTSYSVAFRGSLKGSAGTASNPGRGSNYDIAALPNVGLGVFVQPVTWMRLVGNSTQLAYQLSSDKVEWVTITTVTHSTGSTGFTTAPDYAGIILNPYNTAVGMTVVSWEIA